MNTTFLISGGAGRVVNSIPALEKYEKLNSHDDFKILVAGWEFLFWSHPTLQKRTLGAHQRGNFEHVIKSSKVVCPEPYQLFNFYNQKVNLTEAFDEIINNTEDHSDLNYNCLHVSDYEISKAREFIQSLKQTQRKSRVIVFQPFGSGAHIVNGQPIDPSCRSLLQKDYFEIVKNINQDSVIFYASPPDLKHQADSISVSFDDKQPWLRALVCLIHECDYYIGVCSVGQHIARAFNKPGLVIMGGTNEVNFSYPDHFTIFRKKDIEPKYSPWRLSDAEVEFSDRENNGIMHFDTEEVNEIINIVRQNVNSVKIQSQTTELQVPGVSYG